MPSPDSDFVNVRLPRDTVEQLGTDEWWMLLEDRDYDTVHKACRQALDTPKLTGTIFELDLFRERLERRANEWRSMYGSNSDWEGPDFADDLIDEMAGLKTLIDNCMKQYVTQPEEGTEGDGITATNVTSSDRTFSFPAVSCAPTPEITFTPHDDTEGLELEGGLTATCVVTRCKVDDALQNTLVETVVEGVHSLTCWEKAQLRIKPLQGEGQR